LVAWNKEWSVINDLFVKQNSKRSPSSYSQFLTIKHEPEQHGHST